jgi:hypothetical protein
MMQNQPRELRTGLAAFKLFDNAITKSSEIYIMANFYAIHVVIPIKYAQI